MKPAENGENNNAETFPSSKSSRAEGDSHSRAVEMDDLSSLTAYSEHIERNNYLDSDRDDASDKPTSYKKDTTASSKTLRSYTREEEAAVIKTFDRRLVLFIALLYMLSFLDRSSALLLLPWYCC